MPIPEWFHPIPDADPHAFADAVGQQLALAQAEYDPTGVFAQRHESGWIFRASQDTRSKELPAIYQNEITTIFVNASLRGGDVAVAVGVGEGEEPSDLDRYDSRQEEDLPMVVALLGHVAGVELAELETHPHRALQVLGDSAISLERHSAQKTLELPDVPGGAINVTYSKESGAISGCEITLARQVSLPEGVVIYTQYVAHDDRDLDTLYCWPRAFMLNGDMPMGRGYLDARMNGRGLVSWPRPDKIRMQDFEQRLRRAGNSMIGLLTEEDVARLTSEPLRPEYKLQVPVG